MKYTELIRVKSFGIAAVAYSFNDFCRKIQTCVHCCMAYIVLFYQTIYIRGLSFFLSLFYLIAYSSANVPIKKSHPRKFPYILYETFNPFFTNLFKFGIKKEKGHDSIIMFPVNRLNVTKHTF